MSLLLLKEYLSLLYPGEIRGDCKMIYYLLGRIAITAAVTQHTGNGRNATGRPSQVT